MRIVREKEKLGMTRRSSTQTTARIEVAIGHDGEDCIQNRFSEEFRGFVYF